MALLHRRKAFSLVSRYRFSERSNFSSSTASTALSEPANLSICSSSSFCTPTMKSMPKLSPAAAMHSSLWRYPRSYTTVATSLQVQQSTACCHNHRWAFDWRCRCSNAGVPRVLAQNCTTAAYPPPSPPPEFQGVDQEADADGGAPLNMDDPEGMAGMPGAEDFDRPPYEDANYPEDEEEYEDEEPPPDPEEKLLYSPSDED